MVVPSTFAIPPPNAGRKSQYQYEIRRKGIPALVGDLCSSTRKEIESIGEGF